MRVGEKFEIVDRRLYMLFGATCYRIGGWMDARTEGQDWG